jgi:hypothetical protein
MSTSVNRNKTDSELPLGWKLVSWIEFAQGIIRAKYKFQSEILLRITPKTPYQQPWAVPEYFIELIDSNRTFIAPSKRIRYFHIAWEIALQKMKTISEEKSKS